MTYDRPLAGEGDASNVLLDGERVRAEEYVSDASYKVSSSPSSCCVFCSGPSDCIALPWSQVGPSKALPYRPGRRFISKPTRVISSLDQSVGSEMIEVVTGQRFGVLSISMFPSPLAPILATESCPWWEHISRFYWQLLSVDSAWVLEKLTFC